MRLTEPSPPAVVEGAVVEELRRIQDQRLAALVDADADVLERLHAPGFELVTPTGDVLSRDSYLDDVIAGVWDFTTFEATGPVDVRVRGDSAQVRHRSSTTITIADTGTFGTPTLSTVLYEMHDGSWVAVREHTAPLGDLEPETPDPGIP
ncbi:nuclear transport factor 2 family protein [Cellulosimicrobium sp. Marseille-Q4280]|uniref:nuclear transport factor 2 family protein n=1 Tax=Cellulosimicrobium sp. Marseille-Q4280 TaxID=2937992 RepID=UPI002041A2EC|nr:nuclear transport factor 2 family protein [Cellulosimicrobium sp. Marseille-Q4280]